MRRVIQLAQRGLSMQKTAAMSTVVSPIVLPDLTFDYGALEPIVR